MTPPGIGSCAGDTCGETLIGCSTAVSIARRGPCRTAVITVTSLARLPVCPQPMTKESATRGS